MWRHFDHQADIGIHGSGPSLAVAFEQAGLGGLEVDVAFIPVWFFQPGPGEAVIEAFMDAPRKFAVKVPPDEAPAARAYLAEKYPEALLLDPLQRMQVAAP